MLSQKKLAGWLLLFGALVFFVSMLGAEALSPNYSRTQNYISDLGVGSTALLFNASVFIAGACLLAAAYFLLRSQDSCIFPILLSLCAIGAMGVGVFPQNTGALHFISAGFAFFFGALSALSSSRLKGNPMPMLCAFLGIFSLAALLLFITKNTFSLGEGAMERAIVYPFLAWAVLFGWHLAHS